MTLHMTIDEQWYRKHKGRREPGNERRSAR